jgi:hypothetical protein
MTNIITNDERKNNDAATRCFVFIDTFYQNRSRIRHFVSAHLIPSTLFWCSKGRSRKTFTMEEIAVGARSPSVTNGNGSGGRWVGDDDGFAFDLRFGGKIFCIRVCDFKNP